MSNSISNSDDIIDSRDVIAQIENLEGELQSEYDSLFEDQQVVYDTWLHDKDTEIEGEPPEPPAFEDWVAAQKDDAAAAMHDEAEEYLALKNLADQCEGYGDWSHGETLINVTYFTKYVEDLIDDCYELPKELTSGEWPYRHITVDYEAAAEELKYDYVEVDFDGNSFLMRA
jgi:hypothetical protein